MLLSDWPRAPGFAWAGKMGLDVEFPKSGFSMFSRIGSDFVSIMFGADFRSGTGPEVLGDD